MRYFIGFLVCVGLIVLVVILVLRGLGGGEEQKPQAPLSDYANTSVQVRLTVDGPIVADQLHNAYQITVDRSETRMETFRGYEYESIAMQRYDNNQTSYLNFLKALDFAGFNKGTSKTNNNDERGVCANGTRYIMEIINGSSQIRRYWTTTCKGGTFRGDYSEVLRLFQAQLPPKDFRTLIRGLNLR